jgi:MFS family permease
VFPLSWVFLFTRESPVRFLIIEIVAAVFGVGAIVLSGVIADRVGRKSLLMGSAIAIAIYSGFAPQLLDAGAFGETIYMVIGFILLGLSFGQSSGAIASNFKQMYRYTASALTSDMAWLFGAGFAPLVALLLATNLGVIASGAYLLSGAFWTLLALWLSGQREVGDMDAGESSN